MQIVLNIYYYFGKLFDWLRSVPAVGNGYIRVDVGAGRRKLGEKREDGMFMLRKTHLERTLFHTLAVLLLLTTAGQSADSAKISSTDASPPDSNSSVSLNSSMETPKVQFLHRPCGSEHSDYCLHEGKCVFPRDSNNTPSCICKDSYQGSRCEIYSSFSSGAVNLDQLIGIILGVIVVILFLALLIFCYAYRWYRTSSSLTKLVPSESSVL